MQKLKLLLEKETHTQKPTDTIAKINNKLTSNPVELTVDELIDAILKGQTWTLAMFAEDEEGKLHRTKKSWESQDLFALDFDHDITPEDFIEKATKFKIMPTFIYTSFSDSEKLCSTPSLISESFCNHENDKISSTDSLLTSHE